jgi:drug/metabolite transporter (DMT)-like permease
LFLHNGLKSLTLTGAGSNNGATTQQVMVVNCEDWSRVLDKVKSSRMNRKTAILCGLSSALCFASLNLIVKASTTHFPADELVFSRSLVGIIFLTPLVWRDAPRLFQSNSASLWIRYIGGAIAFFALLFNIHISGVASATMLSNSSALFTVIFSALILHEKITQKEAWGIAWVIVGTLILHSPVGSNLPFKGLVIGLIGAVGGAMGALALRKASNQHPKLFLVWGFCVFCGVLSLLNPSTKWVLTSSTDFLVLFTTGVLGVAGQYFLTLAYSTLPASIASATSLSAIIWGITLESAYFGTIPNSISLLSFGLIVYGLYRIQTEGSVKRKLSMNPPIRPILIPYEEQKLNLC